MEQVKSFRVSEIMVIDIGYNKGGFVENCNSTTIVNDDSVVKITWIVFK